MPGVSSAARRRRTPSSSIGFKAAVLAGLLACACAVGCPRQEAGGGGGGGAVTAAHGETYTRGLGTAYLGAASVHEAVLQGNFNGAKLLLDNVMKQLQATRDRARPDEQRQVLKVEEVGVQLAGQLVLHSPASLKTSQGFMDALVKAQLGEPAAAARKPVARTAGKAVNANLEHAPAAGLDAVVPGQKGALSNDLPDAPPAGDVPGAGKAAAAKTAPAAAAKQARPSAAGQAAKQARQTAAARAKSALQAKQAAAARAKAAQQARQAALAKAKAAQQAQQAASVKAQAAARARQAAVVKARAAKQAKQVAAAKAKAAKQAAAAHAKQAAAAKAKASAAVAAHPTRTAAFRAPKKPGAWPIKPAKGAHGKPPDSELSRMRLAKAVVGAIHAEQALLKGSMTQALGQIKGVRSAIKQAKATGTPWQRQALGRLDKQANQLQLELAHGNPAAFGHAASLVDASLQVQQSFKQASGGQVAHVGGGGGKTKGKPAKKGTKKKPPTKKPAKPRPHPTPREVEPKQNDFFIPAPADPTLDEDHPGALPGKN